MQIDKKSYINSYEAVNCAGNSANLVFESICLKKDCISIDNTYLEDKKLALGKINSDLSFDELLINSVKTVLQNSNLENFSNTLLVIGSSVGGMSQTEKSFFKHKSYCKINYKEHPINAISHKLKKFFSFYDDISFSTACTSSANAIGYAKEVISKRIYKNVLVLGIDSLSYTTVCGFSALSVLSSKQCTPFEENREGMNVSEAIAVILIQDKKNKNSIEVCGYGYSSDAHHMTQPQPQGLGAQKAMQNALKCANIKQEQISYINAHGTGTQANDSSELNAINNVFTINKPYVSSTKSITGHTLGASGAIEAIICVMSLQKQLIPPSKDIKKPEDETLNFSNEIIHKKMNYVLSNSFAFGGNNTSLVFGVCNEH